MSSSNNKTIAKNTTFLYCRMFFVLIVSLYTSRVIINTLGVSDYGVYNVVGSFVSFFSFLNATLASSMQRFFNFEGGRYGDDGYKNVYVTGFWIHVVLAISVLVILETFGIWYINNVMVIPEDRLYAANIVFQTSVLSMLFLIIEIPYTSVILAKEKMDFYAIVSILDVVLKLVIVLVLPLFHSDSLMVFSILTLAITFADFFLYFGYAKHKFPFLKLDARFNKRLFKKLMSFSGWNLVGVFSLLMRGQGLNLILNAFFGTVINAARGVAYQVNNAIVGFSRNINTAFAPQVTVAYSQGGYERVKKMMFSESKICYCLILLIIIPAILEMDNILHIWLGESVPEHAPMFTILVLIDALIHTLNPPLTQVIYADGRIKKYQIVTSIVNILLLPVCWVLLKLGHSPESTFVATIVFSIFFQVSSLLLLNKVFHFQMSSYISKVIVPCLLITLILPVIPGMAHFFVVGNFLRLMTVTALDILLGVVLIYFVVLDKSEKQLAKSILSSVVSHFKR